jgi:hypothetical protein
MGVHIYNRSINENVVMISATRLVRNFYKAMMAFIDDLIVDKKLRERANIRVPTLFQIVPYKEWNSSQVLPYSLGLHEIESP